MTFLQRYNEATSWQDKAMIMEIYHLAMCHNVKGWTLQGTAKEFDCSIGLVSENIRLAHAMHRDLSFLTIESRQEALRRLNGKSMETNRY
jgi:hypothetical protein